MKMEAETGVMYPQAKEHQGNHQKQGERHGTVSPSEPPGRTNPTNTLILDSGSRTKENKSLLF